jgi:hypothetical protein
VTVPGHSTGHKARVGGTREGPAGAVVYRRGGRLLKTVNDECVHAIDPEIDAAWREEARRRCAQLRSGEVKGIPWEEARSQIFGK